MSDASLITHDETDETQGAVAVNRPTYFAGEEPDGGSVRNDLQIYAMLFGAQEVSLTLNFGTGGVQTFTAIHPQLVEYLHEETETPEAA